MNTNEFLKSVMEVVNLKEYSYRKVAPRMVFADGATLSVQVSETHYCTPRSNTAREYYEVEVGFPEGFDMPSDFGEYQDGDSPVWGYVPVSKIDALIEAHGGIVGKQTYAPNPDGGKAIPTVVKF